MSILGERIRKEREERGWEQLDLAEKLDVNQSTISNIEIGRNKTIRKWKEMADLFGIDHDEFKQLMVDSVQAGGKFVPRELKADITAQPAPPMSDRDVPVYGRAQGGADGVFLFNGEVIGWEIRPPQLAGVKEAYATYVDGESMYPRYKPGETVWLNPHKPAARGDDVVVQLRPAEEDAAPFGFIKEYVRRTPTKLVVAQHNPAQEIEFDLADVVSIHPIVFAQRG